MDNGQHKEDTMIERSDTASSTTAMPAGEYWVGDPCYAFDDHALWVALLESAGIDKSPMPRIMEAKVGDAMFIASGTYLGDGTYYDEGGSEYWVDAGLIGATPAREGEVTPEGMRRVVLHEPVMVEYDDGVITVGGLKDAVRIDTRGEEDNDDWEEECEDCGWMPEDCECGNE